jgi:hypothetical protein
VWKAVAAAVILAASSPNLAHAATADADPPPGSCPAPGSWVDPETGASLPHARVIDISHEVPPQDVRQAQSRKNEASGTVDSRLQETYVWALIPQQLDAKKPDINLVSVRVGSGSASLLERAATKVKNQGAIVTDWAPMFLLQEMEKYGLWRAQDGVELEQLWNDFSTYIYLTRLKDENVLLAAVQKGIAEGLFGYAKGKVTDGDWEGVMIGGQPTGVHLGGSYLLKA